MPWKTTTILWPMLVAAVLPLDLAAGLAALPRILARLAVLDAPPRTRPDDERAGPRQLDDFRTRYAVGSGRMRVAS